jgi:hypothetical protein
MDRFHKRLRQIAFFDNPDDAINESGTQSQGLNSGLTDDNLHCFEQFKHRKFKPNQIGIPVPPQFGGNDHL